MRLALNVEVLPCRVEASAESIWLCKETKMVWPTPTWDPQSVSCYQLFGSCNSVLLSPFLEGAETGFTLLMGPPAGHSLFLPAMASSHIIEGHCNKLIKLISSWGEVIEFFVVYSCYLSVCTDLSRAALSEWLAPVMWGYASLEMALVRMKKFFHLI